LRKPVARWQARRRADRDFRAVMANWQQVTVMLPEPRQYLFELNRLWKQYLAETRPHFLPGLATSEISELVQQQQLDLPPDTAQHLLELCRIEDAVFYAHQSFSNARLLELHQIVGTVLQTEHEKRRRAIAASVRPASKRGS
jgi:hypothetical protein